MNIHQHRISHLPATSLRGGVGQLDLALEEIKAMWRNAVLEETFFRMNIHQRRVCHLRAASLRGEGGQQDLAQKELGSNAEEDCVRDCF